MLHNDNQLYTIILLVVLGFLIYYLCNPNKNIDDLENFSNNLTLNPVGSGPSTLFPTIPQKDVVAPNDNFDKTASFEAVKISEKKDLKTIPPVNKEINNAVENITGNEYNVGANLANAFDVVKNPPTQNNVVNMNNVKEYNAKDFLPKEINNDWFNTDFSQAKQNLQDDKLINTDRYVIGVNTVGQSLKNASYDIRGTIPNPKYSVSPWNNSTYEADLNIKPLY